MSNPNDGVRLSDTDPVDGLVFEAALDDPPDTYALVVTADGDITQVTEPFHLHDARKAIGADINVNMAPDHQHVIAVDEWGAVNDLPENVVGWAAYGRSMLHGTVCVWRDDHTPMAESLVVMVEHVGRAVRSGLNFDAVKRDIIAPYWQSAFR